MPSFSTDDNVCPEYAALQDTPKGIIKQNEQDFAYALHFDNTFRRGLDKNASLEVNLGHFIYWLDVHSGKMIENVRTLENEHGREKKAGRLLHIIELADKIVPPRSNEETTSTAESSSIEDPSASKRIAVNNQLLSYAMDLKRHLSRYDAAKA